MSDNSFGSVIQDLYGVMSNDINDAKTEINNRIDEEIQNINAQDNTISLTPIKESNELGKFINKKDSLDDIITVGNYYCANATNNINNIIQESLPESLRGNCSFRLTVMYPMDDSTIEQIIIGKVNDCIIIAARSRNIKANEWWTEWNNVLDESNAEATLEQLDKYGIHLNVGIGSVKTITAKSSQHFDVNTLVPSYETNVGDYFCNGTTAQYVDNIPITGDTVSFRLFNTCDYNTGTSFAGHQIIIYNGTSNLIYIRYYYNGTWYEWHKIMFDSENDHLLQLDSTKYVNKLIKPEGGALINIGVAAYNVGNWWIGTADEATANIDPTSVPAEIVNSAGTAFLRGFRLIGMRSASKTSTSHFYTQIMIANSTAGVKSDSRIYVRSKYGGADNYGPWSKLGYADDFLPFNGADYNVTEIKATEMNKIPSFCCGAPVNLDGLISLDDILTPGAYKSSTKALANANVLATSAPAEACDVDGTFKFGFSLQVYGNTSSTTIRQVFISNPDKDNVTNIKIFYRHRIKPTSTTQPKEFGPWQRMILSDEFYDVQNGTFNKDYRKAMSVQIGKDAQHITDLNDLTYLNETNTDNTGTYWCMSNEYIQYVLNKPASLKSGFRLFSFMGSRTYSCHQIIIENGTNYIYSRYTFYNATTKVRIWSDWERSANKSEVEAVANNTISLDCNNYTTDLLKSDTKLAYALNVATGKIDLGYLNPGNYISRTAAAAKENIYLPSLPTDMVSGSDVHVGFRIEVMRSYDNTQWFQMIITNTNESVGGYTYMYVRSASNKESPKSLTWGQWAKLLNKDDMDFEVECREAADAEEAALRATADNALAANSYSLHPQAQGGTLITKTGEAKVDLGTLLTPGTYYTLNSDTATANVDPASLPEAMVSASTGNPNIGFKMNVEYVNNQSTIAVIRQTIMPNALKATAQSKVGLPRIYIRHRNIYGGTYVWSKWYTTAFTSEVEQSANLGIDATTVILLNKDDEDLPKITVTESGEQVTYVDINKITVGNYYSYYKATSKEVKAEDNIYGAQLPSDMRNATTGKANREFKIWMLRSGTYGFTQLMFAKSTASEKPHMYMRHAGNNTVYAANLTWGEWQKFAFGNDLESAFLLEGTSTKDLASGDDLNNYKTPGNYNSKSATITQTILHKPYEDSIPFRLTVMRNINNASSNTIYQFLTTNDTSTNIQPIYFRRTVNGAPNTWTAWDSLVTASKFDDLNKYAFNLDGKKATAIPKQADLNTYTTPGNYTVTTMETSATIAHKPHTTNAPFRLTVMQNTASTSPRVYQFVTTSTAGTIPTTTSDRIYFRCSFDDNITWTDWDTIASGTALAKVKQDVDEQIKPKLALKYDNADYDNSTHKLTLSSTSSEGLNGATKEIEFVDIKELNNNKIDNATFDSETRMLTLWANEEEIVSVEIPGGGGGGGGGSTTLNVSNQTPWGVYTQVAEGTETVNVQFYWSSTDAMGPTGPGTLDITVNSIKKATMSITQYPETSGVKAAVNIAPYLSSGSNSIKVKITDSQGNFRTLSYTVNVIALSISSSYSESVIQTAGQALKITYKPKGTGSKTVYFKIDGTTKGTTVTSANDVDQEYTLAGSMITAGAHTLTIYCEVTIQGTVVSSNILNYVMLVKGGSDVIVGSTYPATTTTQQYSTVIIPYYVYNNSFTTTTINIKYDGTDYREVEVPNAEQQKISYTFKTQGNHSITIVYNGVVKQTFNFIITESEVDVFVETANRDVYLTAQGRSNTEVEPARSSWVDPTTQVNCTLSNFNFNTNGWIELTKTVGTYEQTIGETVLRINKGASLTVNYKPFEGIATTDPKILGKTIEFRMAVRDVLNYNTELITCYTQDRGIKANSKVILLKGSSIQTNANYKEDEYFTVSIVIQNTTAPSTRYIVYTYIDGIMSNATSFDSTAEYFFQNPGVNISIGCPSSTDATIDIGRIRIYHSDLNRISVLNNVIADTGNVDDMIKLYSHNKVLDDEGKISPALLESQANDLPYMILSGELPPVKGQKTTLSVQYIDSYNPNNSFTASGVQADIQGTSSKDYPRKNYKLKFKNGFDMTASGEHVSKYLLDPKLKATSVFTFKKDYASSEKANNTLLSPLYSDVLRDCVYKFPKQQQDSQLRTGIWGKPIVMFHETGGTMEFIGAYNFNLDKGSDENWGYSESDIDVCVEFADNSSNITKFVYTDELWTKYNLDRAYEFRFQDSRYEFEESTELYKDIPKVIEAYDDLKYLNIFITDMDATDTTISETIRAQRKAAFLQYFPRFFEKDATLFYYLWTELMLMVDQRQKNMMMQHYGLITYDNVDITIGGTTKTYKIPKTTSPRWFFAIYDSDTSLGITNNGTWFTGESFTYEDTSIEDGTHVYNGWDSLLWCNVRLNYQTDIKRIYSTVRTPTTGKTTLTYDYIDNLFDTHQSKWPERIWNEDSYYSYIAPTEDHTAKLNGNKKLQRKFWLYNRFKFMDSKYFSATSDKIKVRVNFQNQSAHDYINGNVNDVDRKLTLTAANDLYGCVQWAGDDYVYSKLTANTPHDFACSYSQMVDQEVYIFSASSLLDIGNLSLFNIGRDSDFSSATKLQKLIICDRDHTNIQNISGLTLPTKAPFLKEIQMANCTNYGRVLNLSSSGFHCPNIEKVDLYGSNAAGITLDDDTVIQELYLPATTTAITLNNAQSLTKFQLEASTNLTTINISKMTQLGTATGYTTSVIDLIDNIPSAKKSIASINWSNFNFGSATSRLTQTQFTALINQLETLYWVDKSATTKVPKYGTFKITNCTIYTVSCSSAERAKLQAMFGNGITVNATTQTFLVTFYRKADGGVFSNPYTQTITGPNKSFVYASTTPTKAPTAQHTYVFAGWSDDPAATTPMANYGTPPQGGWKTDQVRYPIFTATDRLYTVYLKNITV